MKKLILTYKYQWPCLIRKEARFGKKHEINGIIFNKSQLLKQNRAAARCWRGVEGWGGVRRGVMPLT